MATRTLNVVSGMLLAALCGALIAGCKGAKEMAILDLDPKQGGSQGDQYVKITGANFRQDIGYTVYFGAKKSGQVTIVDPQTLLATTPSGLKAGTVDVMIRADDGNAFRLPQVFKIEESAPAGDGMGPKKEEKGNLAY